MNFIKGLISSIGKAFAAVAIMVAILVVLLIWGLFSLITSHPIIVAALIIVVVAAGVATKFLKNK